MKKRALLAGAAALIALLIVFGAFASAYRQLSLLDGSVRTAWTGVEDEYQKRTELVARLVDTVKASLSSEADTLRMTVEARRRARLQLGVRDSEVLEDPAAFEQFQRSQQDLGRALAQLIDRGRVHPDLLAMPGVRALEAQLVNAESRIAIGRLRFNEASERFNLVRARIITSVVSCFFGSRFNPKPYFAGPTADVS